MACAESTLHTLFIAVDDTLFTRMAVVLSNSVVHSLREDLTLVLSYLDQVDDPTDLDFLAARSAALRIAQALPRLKVRQATASSSST